MECSTESEISTEVCRLCLSKSQILKSMLYCSVESLSYAEIYEAFTGFAISDNRGLPTKVCADCETLLISFQNFKSRSKLIEQRLEAYEVMMSQTEEDENYSVKAEQLYDEEILVEALDENHFEVMNEDCVVNEDGDGDIQQEVCSFTPSEDHRGDVACKLHSGVCLKAEAINQMKSEQPNAITCECGVILKNKRSFLKHHSTMHASRSSIIKCRCCSETFPTWRSKITHEANTHNIGLKFECSNCNKKFYRSDHKKVHEKTCKREASFSEKFFACSICLFTFQKNETFQRHLETAHLGANEGDSEYQHRAEEYAEKYSKRKVPIDDRKETTVRDGPKCNICRKSFKNEGSLSKHTNLFHSNHVWPCEKCDAVFVHRSTKISHMSKEHGAQKPFQCSDCDFSCFKRDRFNAHVDKHLNPDKKFPCPICQQEFKSYNTMTLHRARHLTKNTLICPTCSKQFLDKRNFNVHLKLHTGENLHHCPICNRGFSRKDHLKKHQLRKNHFIVEETRE